MQFLYGNFALYSKPRPPNLTAVIRKNKVEMYYTTMSL